jgi:hypothetical protein
MGLALKTSGPLPDVAIPAVGALSKVVIRATDTLAGLLQVV